MTLPDFRNEPFTDFSKPENAAAMRQALADVKAELGKTYPLIIGGERITTEKTIESRNPANPDEVVTLIIQDAISPEETAAAMSAAGLDRYLYDHDDDEWPTLGELIEPYER